MRRAAQTGRAVVRSSTEAIARTRLGGFESFYPSELSYGTQRRVEIARAMATDPRLLLLDEPTAGMNQPERAEISALLRDLRSEGLCQLLVEHDVQMMIDTCDYVFAMNSGKLIAEGRPERRRRRTRRCKRPTSEGSGASMLEIEDLHVSYGNVAGGPRA